MIYHIPIKLLVFLYYSALQITLSSLYTNKDKQKYQYLYYLTDSEDVWSCDHHICHMLAALPLLLPGGPLPPQHYESRLHSAHLPDILLARYVKLLYQPNSLLCNEQKVSAINDRMKIK